MLQNQQMMMMGGNPNNQTRNHMYAAQTQQIAQNAVTN